MVSSRERSGALPGALSPRRMALGVGAGLGIILLAAFVLAALMAGGTIGPNRLQLCAGGAAFLGGLAAGALSGGRRKLFVSAALTALGLWLLLMALGAAAFGGALSAKMCLMVLIILSVSCILGSVVSSFAK